MFKQLFDIFKDNGFELFHVGGSVRDMLLGTEPKDYDFATNAHPDKIKEILIGAGYKTWDVGEKYGTIATFVGNEQVEITTFRRDITSGRHPEVAFSDSLREDLSRRDFTINSMAMDHTGKIYDFFNGQKALQCGLVKTTGLPQIRFAEDPLRMLRAVRFCSKLNFQLDRNCKKVIKKFSQAIMGVSRERWLEEMNKTLLGENIIYALDLLLSTKLLGYILPELYPVTLKNPDIKVRSKDLWKHIKIVVSKTPPILEVRWAALLHDMAKPQTRFENGKEVHFFQHDYLGAEMSHGVAHRLKMGNHLREAISGLIAMHHRIGDVVSRRNTPPVSINALRRAIRDCDKSGCDIKHLLYLFAADCTSGKQHIIERHKAHVRLLFAALKGIKEEDLRPKLPSGIGNAIMERYKLSQGPEIGEIKKTLDDMLLNGEVSSNMKLEEILDIYDKEKKCR